MITRQFYSRFKLVSISLLALVGINITVPTALSLEEQNNLLFAQVSYQNSSQTWNKYFLNRQTSVLMPGIVTKNNKIRGLTSQHGETNYAVTSITLEEDINCSRINCETFLVQVVEEIAREKKMNINSVKPIRLFLPDGTSAVEFTGISQNYNNFKSRLYMSKNSVYILMVMSKEYQLDKEANVFLHSLKTK